MRSAAPPPMLVTGETSGSVDGGRLCDPGYSRCRAIRRAAADGAERRDDRDLRRLVGSPGQAPR